MGTERPRIPLAQAQGIAIRLATSIEHRAPDANVYVGGSVRRLKETCGDIDLVVTGIYAGMAAELLEGDGSNDWVRKTHGPKITTGTVWANGARTERIDCQVWHAERQHLAATMLFTTGPGSLNVRMRVSAMRRGWSLSQYGVRQGNTRLDDPSRGEAGIFEVLDWTYIPPERRDQWNESKE